MDVRLDAGRHHLLNGEKALDEGYLDDSRSHFEAALLQFRGPELRLGEAHAMRGLARVELGSGNLAVAEQCARAAIAQYAEVRAILHRVDSEGLSTELTRDAEEGEGAALVLLGDIQLRSGRADEARATLGYARELLSSLGDVPSVAGVWLAMGRLALRNGRFDVAIESFERAVDVCERSGDQATACHGWMALGEAHRLDGDFAGAEVALDQAIGLARDHHQRALLGRALSHRGSLLAQLQRVDEAHANYQEALVRLRESGDVEAEGFARVGLGDTASQLGRLDALADLAEGARLLGSLDHAHGLGTAMLRLAHHALRIGEAGLGLAAAESARQLWYRLDPVRGVGQALRVEVKALAALKLWPATVAAAHLRAVIAGAVQPNAIEVRDHYRARAPAAMLAELDAIGRDALEDRVEHAVTFALEPVLERFDLDPLALGTVGGALGVVDALAALGPVRPEPTPAPVPRRSEVGAASAQEVSPTLVPPTDDTEAPTLELERSPAPPEPAKTEASAPVAPVDPGDVPEYDGLYDPPDDDGPLDLEEQVTEDLTHDPLLEALARQPAPPGYADLYTPPEPTGDASRRTPSGA